ncbi:ABC transporter substrate-binding protein [Phytoactinopolyspora alkaliphila]|uniref:ABC transporter substrate-binding protein n=1 Tax=Phytoactinopolyspora alkaliphila TaxID=1783498 RepID=A0A6N9YTA4_9ACTN|nr:ABC transporter substrate-binding protein [Phytoactinopolyspora alkaliphila]NED98068.1 ABC transporter substrate-binding protein [Phytoactinopolyspora alkaliphila]
MGMSARVAWSVVVGAALVLSGCGADGPAGDGGGDRSITVRGCAPENPLVPGMTMESCGGQVVDQLFSKLIRYDPDTAEPVYEIAESIDSEDNTTWTVTLRSGWTFHNGDPVTSQSFVDAWNWVAYAPNGTLNSYFFRMIEGYADLQPREAITPDVEITPGMVEKSEMSGLRVIDDLTFEVTLSQPESSFPLRVGYAAFAPMPDEFFADPEAFGRNPIGTGPFEFVEWSQSSEIRLRAYDGYQGAVTPQIDEVTFRIYQDDLAAYNDLQADNVDVIPQLPVSALADDTYQDDLGDRYVEKEALVVSTISFAPEAVDPNVADPRLRQAISMAIDREAITEQIFHGTRQPATGWVAPGVAGYQADVCGVYCTYEPERARELYDEAGGYEGTLTLAYNSDGDNRPWVDAVCNSITEVLDVECAGVPIPDFGTFRSRVNAREVAGMFRNLWQADYPSIENFLAPVYATGASSNDSDYSNPEFDELITEAASLKGDAALAKYNEAEALLPADMPSIPLWYATTVAGYSTKVDNVKITPFQTIDLLSVTIR